MVDVNSMFGSLKEKLGLEPQPQEPNYDEYEDYDEEYAEYEEYADEDEAEDPGYSTRETGRARSLFSSALPKLVSRADAAESTRNHSISLDDAATTSFGRGGRTMVDSSLPAAMTPEGSAAASAAGNRRSEGLDSLFTSTTSSEDNNGAPLSRPVTSASEGLASVAGHRQLQIIRPKTYEDAERVTQALKLGNVAVLVLTTVPQNLMHRMLDFSFGAASALSAQVECVADKTFIICRGDALTSGERDNLAKQGLI